MASRDLHRNVLLEAIKENQDTETRLVQKLAAHIPDLVIQQDHSQCLPFVKKLEGVLMFLDISGFTALSEKYSSNAKTGTDQLTRTLNSYLGALVGGILSSDGDVLKFAGDAILAIWNVNNSKDMSAYVFKAIRCAVDLQEKYGIWNTNVGVKLKVKIGLAAGQVFVAFVGNSEFHHYVTTGKAVDDVGLAEKFCESGYVVVSPSAWLYCNGRSVEHEYLTDGWHVRVKKVYERPVTPPTRSGSEAKVYRTSFLSVMADAAENEPLILKDEFSKHIYRKAVFDLDDDVLANNLRLYISRPVLKKIDDDQPLEYLSEMRQVSIVFMNLILHQDMKKQEYCSLLQDSFDIIYNEVRKMQGCLNKIFMFDKGCTFLVIFGLPGYKHEMDSAHSLKCAYRMSRYLNLVPNIDDVSIGVTTGSTFCGVVGHNTRHEYTVIGRKVNMAARLMMHYPGIVTCDQNTFHHAKLPKQSFCKLVTVKMKGLANIGVIREYIEEVRLTKASAVPSFHYQILGRQPQLDYFNQVLMTMRESQTVGEQRQLIVFEGTSGIGKTHILDSVIRQAENQDIEVVSCVVSMNDARTPYFLVQNLFMDALHLNWDHCHQERENSLHKIFRFEHKIIDDLWLLNDLLILKFEVNEKFKHIDGQVERKNALNDLLYRIINKLTQSKFLLFAIDDGHFIDQESWEFIRHLGRAHRSLVVMTTRPLYQVKNACDKAYEVLTDRKTIKISLEGLETKNLTSLACQLLNVERIPVEIDKIMKSKSCGNPLWCEQFLHALLMADQIRLVPSSLSVSGDSVSGNPSDLQAVSKRKAIKRNLTERQKFMTKANEKIRQSLLVKNNDDRQRPSSPTIAKVDESENNTVCVIAEGCDVTTFKMPESMKALVTAQVDRLKPSDQLFLKCASVIGITFKRDMLESIIPNQTSEKMKNSINRLMDARIIKCASPRPDTYLDNDREEESRLSMCFCPRVSSQDVQSHKWPRGTKNFTNCNLMAFQSTVTQETVYEILLENQRKTLHSAAAMFLEKHSHKCEACGQGEFLPTSLSIDKKKRVPVAVSTNPKLAKLKQEKSPSSVPDDQSSRAKDTRRDNIQTTGLSSGCPSVHMTVIEVQPAPSISNVPANENSLTIDSRLEKLSRRIQRLSQLSPSPSNTAHSASIIDLISEAANKVLEGVDLRGCECTEILTAIYPQLIYHWRASGNVMKTIHFLTQAGAGGIAISNNMQAVSYLEQASEMMDTLNLGRNPLDGSELDMDSDITISSIDIARVESLIGQAYYHMGNFTVSVQHFEHALSSLSKKQPTNRLQIQLAILSQRLTQFFHVHFPARFTGTASKEMAVVKLEQARVLSHLYREYRSMHNDRMALYLALQHLNTAETSNTDFHELINAYSEMIECCRLANWPKLAYAYEMRAFQRCKTTLSVNLHPDDFPTVAQLYVTSLHLHLCHGNISGAVDSGYAAEEIIAKLHDNELALKALPLTAQALLLQNNVSQCMEILEQFEFIVDETDDVVARTWYNCCCLDVFLHGGHYMESFPNCIDFGVSLQSDPTYSDKASMFYIASCLALWYHRRRDWGSGEEWLGHANNNLSTKYDSFMSVQALLNLLECQLLLLWFGLRKTIHSLIERCNNAIKKSFKMLKTTCKQYPIFQPRLLHMQAYHQIMLDNTTKAYKCLRKSLQESNAMGNRLDENWTAFNEQIWLDANHSSPGDSYWAVYVQGLLHDKPSVLKGDLMYFGLPLPAWKDGIYDKYFE